MHSQSSEIQKVRSVDSSQIRSSASNIIASKSTNNQIAPMTKRKQNLTSVHQMKSSSTTDIAVVNVLNKINGQQPTTPTKSMNGNSSNTSSSSSSSAINNNVVTYSKSQQINSVRQMTRSRLSPSNGRTDLCGDDSIRRYQSYPLSALTPSYNSIASSPVSMSMSSPHIGAQHSNYHNPYAIVNYQQQSNLMQMQQHQSQHSLNDMLNRQQYRHNNPFGKKGYHPNYPKSKRNANGNKSNDSSSNVKGYNSNNNNNNNNNNNEYERNTPATKSFKAQQVNQQQITRNGNRSLNSDSSKNVSPSRDHYSSSSSSSSTSSSVPLNKKRDSRTTPTTCTFDGEGVCISRQYVDNYQNSFPMYERVALDELQYDSRSGHHQHQYMYTNPSTGEFATRIISDGGKSQYRIPKANRGNHQKNGHNNIINNNNNNNNINTTNNNAKRNTPPDRFMNHAPQVEIKEPGKPLTCGNRWDRLSLQVWDKFMLFQQKEGTYMKKMRMWKNLLCYVQESFPGYSLLTVGSTISCLGSDVSDVDMCLVDDTKTGQTYFGGDLRSHSVKILQDFEELLRTNNIYGDFHLIPAKVPILRFKDTFHEFEIDLNYNNHVGVLNTHLLHCYCCMDWRLRPLALVVKIWAQCHGINNAKEMTISSYSLVLMVIHFLQCGVSPPVLPCLHDLFPNKFQKYRDIKSVDMHETLDSWFSQNEQSLGELFFEFFHYYRNFDFSNNAISVRLGCTVPIESCKNNNSPKNDAGQWKELCIEEPFDLTNTAHSCYDPIKFNWIKHVFNRSYETLLLTRDITSIFDIPLLSIMP